MGLLENKIHMETCCWRNGTFGDFFKESAKNFDPNNEKMRFRGDFCLICTIAVG